MAVGRFGRAHGIRGEIRLDPKGGLPRGLEGYTRFFVDGPEGVRPIDLADWRSHGDLLLVTPAGGGDRDAAASLTHRTLYVLREELPPLEEGEYYHADVIGCAVADESGAELGLVDDIRSWGDYDMLVVRSGRKTWMLPVIADYVLSMDIKGRLIRVRVPEGLAP